MGLDLDLGQWIIVGLSAVLFVWFFLASTANRKQGIATYRWLRRAMQAYGPTLRAEWIGSSNMGARLAVEKAASPLRQIRAHYLLEPREFLPYWLASRLKGKRDQVVIQLDLRTPPKGDLEIGRVSGRQANAASVRERIHPDFQIVHAAGETERIMQSIEAFLASQGEAVERVRIQRRTPHLELEARLKPLLRAPANSYLSSLLALCQNRDS